MSDQKDDEVQQEQAPNVVSEPVVPSDADLVPDNRGVEEVVPQGRLDRVGGLNAGGAFGHTPDHGDANASVLAGDPESEGADHSASEEQ
jgi:hypothetical protein